MIFKLVYKDLLAYKKLIAGIFLSHMLLAGVFTFRYYQWNIYVMYGYLIISFAGSFICFSEKKQNTETLTCSLPVTRSSIVAAKYLTSAIIAATGIFLWFLNAYIFDLIYTDAVTNFYQITYPKVLFMALFFLSINMSIFLPAVFRLRLLGLILTYSISLTIAVLTIPLIFYPYKSSYIPHFAAEDFFLISVLSVIMIILPIISLLLSLRIYNRQDL